MCVCRISIAIVANVMGQAMLFAARPKCMSGFLQSIIHSDTVKLECGCLLCGLQGHCICAEPGLVSSWAICVQLTSIERTTECGQRCSADLAESRGGKSDGSCGTFQCVWKVFQFFFSRDVQNWFEKCAHAGERALHLFPGR